jgi:hypothetical protein
MKKIYKNIKYYILLCIILLLIIFILNYFYKNKNYIEFFDEKNIYFLSANETYNVLIKNSDKYYDSFFENDYKARNILNINEYLEKIKKSVNEFDDKQRKKIIKSINLSKEKINKINEIWIDINKFNEIPWIIGCIKGKLYENGLPHTRDNVIIISSENVDKYTIEKLMKTLVHEKIHIYQKMYPKDCEIFLNKLSFKKYKLREKSDNIRANPDLDKWIYKDINGKIYQAKYNDNPKSIEDITYLPFNNQSFEHPYEKMAIHIENQL